MIWCSCVLSLCFLVGLFRHQELPGERFLGFFHIAGVFQMIRWVVLPVSAVVEVDRLEQQDVLRSAKHRLGALENDDVRVGTTGYE